VCPGAAGNVCRMIQDMLRAEHAVRVPSDIPQPAGTLPSFEADLS
jgi:hypothetical protein